ncbi:MAG: hypothetical protein RSA49_05135 [Anaerovoracaceae bacterium]
MKRLKRKREIVVNAENRNKFCAYCGHRFVPGDLAVLCVFEEKGKEDYVRMLCSSCKSKRYIAEEELVTVIEKKVSSDPAETKMTKKEITELMNSKSNISFLEGIYLIPSEASSEVNFTFGDDEIKGDVKFVRISNGIIQSLGIKDIKDVKSCFSSNEQEKTRWELM